MIKGGEGGVCFSFLRLLVAPVRKMDCMQQTRHKVSGALQICILCIFSWKYFFRFYSCIAGFIAVVFAQMTDVRFKLVPNFVSLFYPV